MTNLLATLRAGLLGRPLLAAGDRAPDFAVRDQDGNLQHLRQFRGRWLVLYFYPKDATPGCTREACNLRDEHDAIRAQGAEVLGVSMDSEAAHRAFAVRYGLPFPLLSDANGELSRAYGTSFKLGPLRFARRHTFLIAPDGRIARIYRRVSPATHGTELVQELRALQD